MGILWDFGFMIIDLKSPFKSRYRYISGEN